METYGTLEYIPGAKKKAEKPQSDQDEDPSQYKSAFRAGRWRISGYQPAAMICKIVSQTTQPDMGVADVPDEISNVEHINWLLMRYPLQILSSEKWNSRLDELGSIKEQRKGLSTLSKMEITKPTFIGQLMDHQKVGLDFFYKTSGMALLADERGLGKGVQTLAYLATEPTALPALIVCKLTMVTKWKREIFRFVRKEDKSDPIVKTIRTGSNNPLPRADFYIINYELVKKRSDDLYAMGIKTIVSDECQHLSHSGTLKYKGVKNIAAAESVKHRIGLSGTPCYNHGSEIWAIVDFIYPGLLGSEAEFRQEYLSRWSVEVLESKRQLLFETLTQNLMLRRHKEVLSLPPLTRHREEIDIDEEYYDKEMKILLDRIEKEIGEGPTSLALINQKQRALSQGERQIAGVSKIPWIVEFVKDLMEDEEPVVVFVHHRVVHQLLHEKLKEFNPVSIIGEQNENVRQINIDAFQEGHSKLMIAGIRAGSEGIELTAARYVVFGELDWSPKVHDQAEGRLQRIGQERPVFAYYLEGKDTYDEHIAEILVDKKLELDSIFGDKSEDESEGLMDKRTQDLLSFVRARLGRQLKIDENAKKAIIAENERQELLAKELVKTGQIPG